MSDRLWVSTRKGLFRLGSTNNGWAVEQVSFLGHNVSLAFPDHRDGSVYAALNLGHFGVKLHRSDDAGGTWTEVSVPAYDPTEDGKGPSLQQIWAIEAAGPKASDGLWCGTGPGGLFFSFDRGQTWSLNRSLWDRPERQQWFGGGTEHPALHSICVDPRDKRNVSVAVSCGGVSTTKDGGETWTSLSTGMFAEFMPPGQQENPNIQDAHRMVRCPSAPDTLWVQHHNGVFCSTDDAQIWRHVTGLTPSSFGFVVAVHPSKPETAWFVPGVKDETRIPIDGQLCVTRTEDGGRTCAVLRNGLPQEHCYDLVYRHSLDIDETGNRLAFGSTTGNLWTTDNGGDTWTALPNHLPPIYAVRFG